MSYTKTVLSDSPQAYYPLNEYSGSSVADSSGNSHTGTYTSIQSYRNGVPWATLDARAIAGVALNGNSSKIDLGSSSYLSGAAQVSIEFFAKFLSIPNTTLSSPPAVFFTKVDSSSWIPAFAMFLNNNSIKLQARAGISDSDQVATYTFTDTSSWHHFIVHFDYAADTISLYVDGTRVVTQSVTFTPTSVSVYGNILIGNYVDSNSANVFCQCLISDVAIYKNAAIGQSLAYRHYFNAFHGYMATLLNDSPALLYKLDEAAGANLIDYSGNGRTGSASNILAYQQQNPLISTPSMYGMSGDGSTSFITGPTPSFVTNATQLTIEFSFKALNPSLASDTTFFFIPTGSVGYALLFIGLNTNSLKISVRSTGTETIQTFTFGFSDISSWHHLVVHMDWSAKWLLVYLDNVLVIDKFCTLTNAYATAGALSRILCSTNTSGVNNLFCSTYISHVAWYINKATSAIKRMVERHYQSAQWTSVENYLTNVCPIWYPFGNSAQSVLCGSSPYPATQYIDSNSQTLLALPNSSVVGAKFNKSYVQVDSLNIDTTAGFTISVTVKISTVIYSGMLFYFGNGGLYDSISAGYAANSLDVFFKVYVGNTLAISLTASNALRLNDTQIFYFVFNPTTHTVAIYIDGRVVASTTYNGTLPLVTRSMNLWGASPKSLKSLPTNPYFNLEVTRQPFDGVNLSTQPFTNKLPIASIFGTPFLQQENSMFGKSALYLNGSSSALSLLTHSFDCVNSGDFTAECCVYVFPDTLSASASCIFAKWAQTTGYMEIVVYLVNGVLKCLFFPVTSSSPFITDTVTFTPNVWTHIAICRKGSSFYLAKNGVVVATVTNATVTANGAASWSLGNYFSSTKIIGASGTTYFHGLIDRFVVTRGVAKYTASYKNHTLNYVNQTNQALPLILLHCEGANNGTTFVDELGHALTRYGDTKTSNIQAKFGSTSMYVDGTGDYIVLTSNTDFALGLGDFTIDLWAYPTVNSSTYKCLFHTGNSCGLYLKNNTFLWYDGGDRCVSSAVTINAWHHVAVCRIGTTLDVYVDLVKATSFTTSRNFAAAAWYIACNSSNGELYTGYLDEIRVVRGVGLFTQNASDLLPKAPYYSDFNPYGEELYRDYLALFLPFEGNNNTSDFYDVTGKTVTITGTPKLTTASYAIGKSSAVFNGSTDLLDVAYDAVFDWGTISVSSQYTVEFLLKVANTNDMALLSHGLPGSAGAGNVGWSIHVSNGILSLSVGAADGVATWTLSAAAIITNQWHHVAVVLDSGIPRIFVNGFLAAGTFTAGTTFIGKNTTTNSYGLRIGASHTDNVTTSPTNWLNGNLDQLRITHHVCRYFMWYPLYPYAYRVNNTIDHSNDPLIDNVILLMDFESTDNSTSFVDQKNHTIAVVGNAKHSAANSRTGNTSGLFSSAGDYLSVTCGTEFNFGSGDFTIELWFCCTNLTGVQYLLSKYVTWSTNVDFSLEKQSGNTLRFCGADSIPLALISNTVIVAGQWYHVAVCRNGYNTLLFINGLLETYYSATSAQLIPNDQTTLRIGADNSGNQGFIGYIDELRISTCARYSSTGFPLWSLPLPKYGVTIDLRFEGDDDSSVFYKEDGLALTVSGTPVITTDKKKYGTSSGYFNGLAGTDYLSALATHGNLGNRFTIECWCYPLSVPTTYPTVASASLKRWDLLGQGSNSTTGSQYLAYTNAQKFQFYRGAALSGGALDLSSSSSFAPNSWYHVALTCDGTTWRLFVNGVLEASSVSSVSWINTGYTFDIGRQCPGSYTTYGSYWFGYIDCLRITNGWARYTANFTPSYDSWLSPYEDFVDGYMAHAQIWAEPLTQRAMLRHTVGQKTSVWSAILNMSGVLGYWPMGEGGGTAITDIFSGYDGATSGNPTFGLVDYVAADYNRHGRLVLDGVDDYVTFPALPLGTEFSLFIWVKGLSWAVNTRLFEFTATSCSVFMDVNVGTPNTLSLGIKTSDGYQVFTSSISANYFDRNLITITAKAQNTLAVYINGALLGSMAIDQFALDSPAANILGGNSAASSLTSASFNDMLWFNRQLSSTEVLALFSAGFATVPAFGWVAPNTNLELTSEFYQFRYYLKGTVRLEAVPTDADVFIYLASTGILEGHVVSDRISGKYEWRTSLNDFYRVVCCPIYNEKDWKPSTLYQLGDVVIPLVQTGFYYQCTTSGISSAFFEPTWPMVVGATVSDGSIVWNCQDVISRGHVHGPLLPYDIDRAKYVASQILVPALNLAFNGYVDSGYATIVDNISNLYLNGSQSNYYAGINVNSDIATLTSDTIQISFKRTSSGSWYNDTFTDAKFTLYFYVDQDPSTLTFPVTPLGYFQPTYDGTKTVRINFRGTTSAAIGVNESISGVTTSNGGFTSGHFNGTTITTVRLVKNSSGVFDLSVYENGVLKYYQAGILTVTNPVAFFILFHYHNYMNANHQELLTNLGIVQV